MDCKYSISYILILLYPLSFLNNRKPNPKYYSIPNSKRNFEFINPKQANYEIKGNMRQYKQKEESKEIPQFSSISKKDIPNSKRTLIPSYQPLNSKENLHHKATSFYSYKFNTNSVGPDFIPNEEPKPLTKRKSAGRILQESNPPLNIRQLKPNRFHQKYIETSQINNIPGPAIMKRVEEKKTRTENMPVNKGEKCIKYYSKNYYSGNNNSNKKYALRNKDIESFQRKIFRDYNSNVACLPGVTINEKEKNRTLFAINTKKNESHISFGNNNENINTSNIRNKYDYNKKNNNVIQRPLSFSGKRIIRDRNKESKSNSRMANNKINRVGYFYTNERSSYENNFSESFRKQQKYMTDKNKSQIIFG